MSEMIEVYGACHCRSIRFMVKVFRSVKTLLCNCSMCKLTAYEHLIVPKENFTLVQGADKISSYRFGTQQAEHLFCKKCGIKSYYQPRSHPNAYSINVAALDNASLIEIEQENFDGQNWERAKASLVE